MRTHKAKVQIENNRSNRQERVDYKTKITYNSMKTPTS